MSIQAQRLLLICFLIAMTTLSNVSDAQTSADEIAEDSLVFFSRVNAYRIGADTQSELLVDRFFPGQSNAGSFFCTGARVNKDWILTSKSCANSVMSILSEDQTSEAFLGTESLIKFFSKNKPKGIGYTTVTQNIILGDRIALVGIESAESADGYPSLNRAESDVMSGNVQIIGTGFFRIGTDCGLSTYSSFEPQIFRF